MGAATKYDTDFYGWTQAQADALKNRRVDDLDFENLLEEVESMGASERRQMVSRLKVLMMHLLKWRHQPDRRGKSWELTIKEQRRRIPRHLKENPSLQAKMPDMLEEAYEDALFLAEAETGLHQSFFPVDCPWTLEQMLDAEFWPDTETQ
ncbi:DUF29 domain-containing protein [Candidatus Thiothrix sp. Deng01]|uniref:DUF29 domain-containing protein n=1 Tax=Candidatus Thiothrix phosphatis TaxID=3112415 RepID=A0ABU6CWK8_9GAMM|nr:DUF29 domain-containing protein [Candidatus Thiothrix sp. Deng01]MEB4591222.1 DUF29 domain-containing protein [Candidatus Thiothrix sp. Deng01]